MAEIVFSPRARRDLIEIWIYIAEDDIDAADRLLDLIEEAIDGLAAMPRMGHERRDLTDQDVRFWPVKSYLVIYRDGKPMEIVRILSAYRDVAALLDGR